MGGPFGGKLLRISTYPTMVDNNTNYQTHQIVQKLKYYILDYSLWTFGPNGALISDKTGLLMFPNKGWKYFRGAFNHSI